MAYSYPMYFIDIDADDQTTLDDVRLIAERWQQEHGVPHAPEYSSGSSSDGGNSLGVMLIELIPEHLFEQLVSDIREAFPHFTVRAEKSAMESLDAEDWEKMKRGEPHEVRKRGQLN